MFRAHRFAYLPSWRRCCVSRTPWACCVSMCVWGPRRVPLRIKKKRCKIRAWEQNLLPFQTNSRVELYSTLSQHALGQEFKLICTSTRSADRSCNQSSTDTTIDLLDLNKGLRFLDVFCLGFGGGLGPRDCKSFRSLRHPQRFGPRGRFNKVYWSSGWENPCFIAVEKSRSVLSQ